MLPNTFYRLSEDIFAAYIFLKLFDTYKPIESDNVHSAVLKIPRFLF